MQPVGRLTRGSCLRLALLRVCSCPWHFVAKTKVPSFVQSRLLFSPAEIICLNCREQHSAKGHQHKALSPEQALI